MEGLRITERGASSAKQVMPEVIRQKTSTKHHGAEPSKETVHNCNTLQEARDRMINIDPVKIFADKNLPQNHPLKVLLLAERSLLKPEEFIAKLESWLCLLREIKY